MRWMGFGLGIVVLLVAGCEGRPLAARGGSGLFGLPAGPPAALVPPEETSELDFQPVGGWMEGSIGEVRDFSGELTLVEPAGEGFWLETQGPDWAAMTMFSLETGEGPRFGVACSGPSPGVWETDVPAQEVEIAVTEPTADRDGVVDAVIHLTNGDTVTAAVVIR